MKNVLLFVLPEGETEPMLTGAFDTLKEAQARAESLDTTAQFFIYGIRSHGRSVKVAWENQNPHRGHIRNRSKSWSDADIDYLITAKQKGIHSKQIAEHLGRTLSSVAVFYNRLNHPKKLESKS